MFKFELTEQQVEVIGRALANAPYGQVAGVIADLQRQVNEQRKQPLPVQTNGKTDENHAGRV